MYKICIVNNNQIELAHVTEKISNLFKSNLLNISINPFDKLEDIDQSVDYNVLFLDIDQFYTESIEFVKEYQLLHSDVLVVFITSYSNIVFKVLCVHPFDFIQKGNFDLVIERTIKHLILKLQRDNDYVSFKFGHVINNLRISDIMYCESYDHTVFIYLKDNRYRFRMKLSTVEAKINSTAFFMIRKSFLVNWKYVSTIENGSVIFTNGFKMEISKRRLKNAVAAFEKYKIWYL